MFKSHIEIAKSFRYDPANDKYFYHLKEKWAVGDEVIVKDEWISVSKDVYDFLRRDAWREYKRQERSSRCHKEDGTRCMEDCKNCPKGKVSRDGLPLSLEQLMEAGMFVEDVLSVESYIENQELLEALHEAVSSLQGRDRRIIALYAQGVSQRDIGEAVGMSQSGIRYQEKSLFARLAQMLK